MKKINIKFFEVCKYLGEDIESEPCKLVKQHINECPDCSVYVDKIKKVVKLYRIVDNFDDIPADVDKKLFAKLNLSPKKE